MAYQDEGKYFQYLKGKKVILVGPAGYLRGKGKGPYIDSFDVVVKVNEGHPAKYPEDYGSRTDVLYKVFGHIWERIKASKITVHRERRKLRGIRWLVSRYEPAERKFNRLGRLLGERVNWTAVPNGFKQTFKVEKLPNTGVFALVHLLTSELKSLEVIGFDFYASGVYQGYDNKDLGRHDRDSQLKMLGEITDKRLKLNPELGRLVNESANRNTSKVGK